jgi:hypothetical protein
VVRWLAKKRLLDVRPAEERSNEPPPQTALEACAEAALQHGTFVKLDEDGTVRGEDENARFQPRHRKGPLTAEIDGFNVQAAVRLVVPRALGQAPDGAHRAGGPYTRGARGERRTGRETTRDADHAHPGMESTPAAPVPADVKPAEAAPQRVTLASSAAAPSAASATGVNVGAHANPGSPEDFGRESLRLAQGVVLTAQGISVQHLERLLGGELLAATPRLPWSQLLRRTYGFDVHRCGCGGRLRLVTAITDKAVARAILTHLGLPVDARWSRGRDPALVYDDLESP